MFYIPNDMFYKFFHHIVYKSNACVKYWSSKLGLRSLSYCLRPAVRTAVYYVAYALTLRHNISVVVLFFLIVSELYFIVFCDVYQPVIISIEMKRARSPISENTIRHLVEDEGSSDEDYLGETYVCELPDNPDLSPSECWSEDDDTDEDPTYDPDQPTTSSRSVGLKLKQYARLHPMLSDTSDDDDETVPLGVDSRQSEVNNDRSIIRQNLLIHSVHSQGSENRPRPSPSLGNAGLHIESTSSEEEEEDGTDWYEVTEETDAGFRPNHNITFQELTEPKHGPPKTHYQAHISNYFLLYRYCKHL